MAKNDIPVDESKNHVKPTAEELDAKAEQALKELENMEDKPDEDAEDETPEEENGNDEKEGEKDDAEKDGDDGEGKDEPEEVPQKVLNKKLDELPKEEIAKKLRESSREALVLHARNKMVQDAIKKASSIPEPTEDELKAEYDGWDDLDDFSKKMAKDNYINSRRMEAMTSVTVDFEKQTEWDGKVDKYLEDPKTLADIPELDGREEEFKAFASKPTRIGLDFEDLTKAFLFDIDTEKKTRPGKKGSQLPTGMSSVKKSSPDAGKISVEEGSRLRKTNYNKYVELLKAGKISTDI